MHQIPLAPQIREYARAVHALLRPIFPRTIGLFDEGRT